MWVSQSPQTFPRFPHFPNPISPKQQPPAVALHLPSSSPAAATTNNSNSLIQSLCKQGNLKQALHALSRESKPTQHTYELLILSCANQSSLSDAIAVHRHLLDDGFDKDPFLATKLIDMYSNLESVDLARKVFDKIPRRTIFVWNALFKALTLADQGTETLNLYRQMNHNCTRSDRFTYTYILKACVASESIGSLLSKGKEVHAHILRHGFGENVNIMTTLIDTYARFGSTSYVKGVFEGMPTKNVVSWSAVIACFARNGEPVEALNFFRKLMMEEDNVSPNSVTMVSVLQACAALAALEHGKLIHGYILRKGLESVLPVINTLVTMYARCGKLESAQRVFDQVDRRDVVMWNSLISCYGLHGFGKKAIEIFREMISDGILPTIITFVSVLGACSHEGLVEEGKILFDSMRRDHGIDPTVEHYASMVDLLGRANRLDEAAKVIEDMPMKPGANVWGSLLGSCRIHCNIELAERASQKLYELEPTNAGNYVLMADVYTDAKMWEEAKRVKKRIEAQGLQRVPGCCWIEVNKKLYSFTSVDESDPQCADLHGLIVKLITEMKEKGYEATNAEASIDLNSEEKREFTLGHSGKLAVAFGLINSKRGKTIRITKNLRLCENCHSFTKFASKNAQIEILIRDVNRFHHFRDGACSCADYW